MLLGALRSALSAKLRDGELKVVQAFDFDDHKTKNADAALLARSCEVCWSTSVLVVDNGRRTAI